MLKRKPRKVSLKRALHAFARRGLNYGNLQKGDYKWLFAGYVHGAFADAKLPDDMDAVAFYQVFEPISSKYGLVVYRDRDDKPFAMVLFTSMESHVKETKVFFMPWATLCNKVLALVHFYGSAAQTFNVVVLADDDTRDLFAHVGTYRLLRKIGEVREAFGKESGPGYYYQARKVNTPVLKPLVL